MNNLRAEPKALEFDKMSADSRSELQHIHKHMVVCPVDKASHDYGLICKPLYQTLLQRELNNQDVLGKF